MKKWYRQWVHNKELTKQLSNKSKRCTLKQRVLFEDARFKLFKLMQKEKNYYNILYADRNADETKLKKCFHKAALQYHPDKGGTD